MLVLLDSAELHRRSSQFKEAVRWSGKAARLRSGWCGGRPTFWIKGLVGSSFSFSRRVRKVFPSALSPDGQSFAVWARWDPSSHHRRKLWVSSSGRVPHPSVFCSGFALVNRSAFCSSGSGSRLCLAVGLGLLGALLQFLLLGLALSIGVTALARLVETGPMLLLLDEFLNS
ncbi:unnamed protein product [Brassica oleracea var. botrytis]|uniref:(rape) hypothetical protein n=1 Tax=Brassica napus TaxID=3708 RepID=A0A816LD89_BRANA|nr:unnamed protein product [Brassica napus]